jgi:hypothetical protein
LQEQYAAECAPAEFPLLRGASCVQDVGQVSFCRHWFPLAAT